MDNLYENIEVDPDSVAAMQKDGTAFKLLDIREDWEFEYCRIPGGVHFPMGQIESRHAGELDRSEKIVLYCHSGMRSLQVAAWLRQEGYTDVKSLAGGVNRWADEIDPDMPRY